MGEDQIGAMRQLLTVILGGIEIGNLQIAKDAVRRLDAALTACGSCPLGVECPLGVMMRAAGLSEKVSRAG